MKSMTKTAGLLGLASLVVVAVFLGLGPAGDLLPVAEATHIGCGATLGPGGKFKLDSDLICSADPALTLNSAELNGQNHTLTCTSVNVGIRITGTEAKLKNLNVTGCSVGVEVAGTGGHRVSDVNATNNSSLGFSIGSNNNRLSENTATGATLNDNGAGFVVAGDNNRLSENVANHNTHGVGIGPGTNNRFSENIVTNNDCHGIIVDGLNTLVSENTANNNGCAGILVRGHDNAIEENTATGNSPSGNHQDLMDFNSNCDNNRWEENTFGTRNQACIN